MKRHELIELRMGVCPRHQVGASRRVWRQVDARANAGILKIRYCDLKALFTNLQNKPIHYILFFFLFLSPNFSCLVFEE